MGAHAHGHAEKAPILVIPSCLWLYLCDERR